MDEIGGLYTGNGRRARFGVVSVDARIMPPPMTGLYLVGENWEWWYVDAEAGLYVRVARWKAGGSFVETSISDQARVVGRTIGIPSEIEIGVQLGMADDPWHWYKAGDSVTASVSVTTEIWKRQEPQLRLHLMKQLATEIGLRLLARTGQDHRVRVGEVKAASLSDYMVEARVVAWLSPIYPEDVQE